MTNEEKYIGLAKLIEVEIGERFKFEGVDDVYEIKTNGIFYIDYADRPSISPTSINSLLNGKIIKLPSKPKIGDSYYVPCFHIKNEIVTEHQWINSTVDSYLFNTIGVYLTYEEAEEVYYKMINSIK